MKFLKSQKSAIAETLNQLDAIREMIADAQAKLAQIEAAPLSLAEAENAVDAWLDQAATAGVDALRVGTTFTDREASRRGPSLPIITVEGHRDASRATEILLGLIAAAARPALRKILIEQVQDRLATTPGLSAADRAAGMQKAQAALLALEAAEEQIVRSLEDAGVQIIRRDDLNPALLLATDATLVRLAG